MKYLLKRYYWEKLTVCSYHVTYAFQSESTIYSCLNVKELLARSRLEIWNLSDCNWTRTHNHLVHKRTLNHLAKLAFFFLFFFFSFLIYGYNFVSLLGQTRQWQRGEYELSSLAKWLSVRLRTKWLWVRVQLQSLKLQISRLLRARSSLTFKPLQSVDSLWNAYVTR